MRNTFLILMLLVIVNTFGQNWTVQLVKKNQDQKLPEDVSIYNQNNFLLFENAVYDLSVEGIPTGYSRIIEIKKDTIYATNYFNEAFAQGFGQQLDTLALVPDQIKGMNQISDRSLGLVQRLSFNKYEFIFHEVVDAYRYPDMERALSIEDDIVVQVIPVLTQQGYDLMYEDDGMLYYYQGVQQDSNTIEMDTEYKSSWIGSPLFHSIDKINGLSFNILGTMKSLKKERLEVNGLNLDVNPFSPFLTVIHGISGGFYTDRSEMWDFTKEEANAYLDANQPNVFIDGVNLSTHAVGQIAIDGLNISLHTAINTIDGVSITALQTMTNSFSGVQISGWRNMTYRGRGLQVALFNTAKDFRGIQLGLWNRNGKRSLPFINWQFSE